MRRKEVDEILRDDCVMLGLRKVTGGDDDTSWLPRPAGICVRMPASPHQVASPSRATGAPAAAHECYTCQNWNACTFILISRCTIHLIEACR